MSAYLKQVSPLAPEQARKYLSNHATNMEQLEFLLGLSNYLKSCQMLLGLNTCTKMEKLKNMGFKNKLKAVGPFSYLSVVDK